MKADRRIELLHELGNMLRQYLAQPVCDHNHPFLGELHKTIYKQQLNNGWFTPQYVKEALKSVSGWLNREKLTQWITPYSLPKKGEDRRTLGIVMAGNLPLVGFHDFLAGFLSGHKLQIRLSSKDPDLLPLLCSFLLEQESSIKSQINFPSKGFRNIDAAIATGSSNTSRYFEYTYAEKPHIIRKNRNSIALLEGKETEAELKSLARDVFQFYGLGCRNVTKIYIPDKGLLSKLVSVWQEEKGLAGNPKYAGNYLYQKAIYHTLGEKIIDGNFFILKENNALSTAVAVVNYELYKNRSSVTEQLDLYKDQIQCIIGKGFLPFGSSQQPRLNDYADNVDSLKFLSDL